ncbi:DUF905 family protein [Escherichia coli]|uniref:DUF905 family protein n=1 Tax=Escherichia coli TaxID=562 RepID=UPI0032B52CC8|nr:DUF905 family protein [Escherichia coli]
MSDCHPVLLPEGPFSREQAMAVTTAYRNVFTEDDQGTHFRRLYHNAEGLLVNLIHFIHQAASSPGDAAFSLITSVSLNH